MSAKKTTHAAAPAPTQAPAPAPAQAEAPKAAQKITPTSKLTVKTICGTPDASKLPALRTNVSDANPEGDANPTPEVRICRIAGYADGVKEGTSTYGQWRALTGEFSAVNFGTGEIFVGKTAIIPGSMGEALISTTEEKLQEDAAAKVSFSVDVFVRRSARDAKKHEYIVRPVLETEFKSPAVALLTMG